jgi:DNA-damage-inducible protein J
MPKGAWIKVRVEPAIKEQAEQIFTALGVSTSDAIGMFLREVILRRGMPFDLAIPNDETIAALEELKWGGGEVFRSSTRALFEELAYACNVPVHEAGPI